MAVLMKAYFFFSFSSGVDRSFSFLILSLEEEPEPEATGENFFIPGTAFEGYVLDGTALELSKALTPWPPGVADD